MTKFRIAKGVMHTVDPIYYIEESRFFGLIWVAFYPDMSLNRVTFLDYKSAEEYVKRLNEVYK